MPVTDPAARYPRVLDLAQPTRTGYRVAGGFFVVIGIALLIAFGVVVGFQNITRNIEGAIAAVIGLALFLYGIALFVRGPQISATLTQTEVVVRGLFWNTTIPRSSITQVTSYPRIVWTTAEGRKQTTPVAALNLNARARADATLRGRTDAMIADLKKWSKSRG